LPRRRNEAKGTPSVQRAVEDLAQALAGLLHQPDWKCGNSGAIGDIQASRAPSRANWFATLLIDDDSIAKRLEIEEII
jgi:hypothetical protein